MNVLLSTISTEGSMLINRNKPVKERTNMTTHDNEHCKAENCTCDPCECTEENQCDCE